METMNMCQSCGMPMGTTDEMYGTNKDGSKSTDYCKFCYGEGRFFKEETMDEMIESCIPFVKEDKPEMSDDEIRGLLSTLYPTLKRWQLG